MHSPEERAAEKFSEGYNCAQAVFSTFAPELGLAEQNALNVAAGFGAGMARLQEVCGAVTGAFMAIGARYGSAEPSDDSAKTKTYQSVREFDRRFRTHHGSILCREILGVDLNTDEGQRELKKKDLFNTICARCVRDAAQIVHELISRK